MLLEGIKRSVAAWVQAWFGLYQGLFVWSSERHRLMMFSPRLFTQSVNRAVPAAAAGEQLKRCNALIRAALDGRNPPQEGASRGSDQPPAGPGAHT